MDSMDKNVGSTSFPAFPTYDDSVMHISATANKSQDFGAFSPFGETPDNKSSVESKEFADFFLVTEEKQQPQQQQQVSDEGIRQSPSNDAPSLADASSHSDSESEEGSISFATGGDNVPGHQAGIISSITNRIWGVETPVVDDDDHHHGTAGVSEQSELTLEQTDLNDLGGADSHAEPLETSTPQTAQQDQHQEEMQSEDDLLRFEADDFDSWASSKASKSSKASSKKKKKKKKKKTKSSRQNKELNKSPSEDLRNAWSETSVVFRTLPDEQLKYDSGDDSEQENIPNSWSESSGVLGILQDEHELDNDVNNAMPLKKTDSGVDSEQELGNALSSNDIFYEAAQDEEIIEQEEGESSSVESITKSYKYLQDSLKQMESVDGEDEDDPEDEQSMHKSLAGLVTAIRGEASVVSDDDAPPPIPISSPAEESKEPLEEEDDDAQSIASEQSDSLYNNLIATLNGISSGYDNKKGKTSSDFSAASKTMLTESATSLDRGDFNSALEEEDEDPSPEAFAIMEGPFDDISHSAFTAASKVSALTNNTLDDLDDSMSHRSWGSRGSLSRRSYGTISTKSTKSTKSSLRSSDRSRRSSGNKSVTFRNLYTPEIFHYDDRSVDSGSSTVCSDELKSDPYDTKMYSLKKADKPRSTIADSILGDMANEPLVPRRQKRVDGRNERNIMTEVLSKLKRTRDRLGIEEDAIASSSNITLEFDSEELFAEVVAKLDRIRTLLDSSGYCEYSVDGGETKSEVDDSLIKVSYDL
eukprot:scaffold105107_cov45-Attheya_sp.AAC.2